MYRTVDAIFWTDPKVRRLTAKAKLLFLYLITNGHSHPSGIYYLPRDFIAKETSLSKSELDSALDTLSGAGLACYDASHEVIWVINMLKYQCRGKKLLRAAALQLRSCHQSVLVSAFVSRYPQVAELLSDSELDRVSGPESLCHSEQEQEQEQEQEINPPTPLSKKFVTPTIEEVRAYCIERGNSISPETFVDHYEANGWHVGKNKMKDWRAAVRTWEKNDSRRNSKPAQFAGIREWCAGTDPNELHPDDPRATT